MSEKKTHLFRIVISFFVLFSGVVPSAAQTRKVIRGTVTDAETGEGLPVAHIQVAGTGTGTVTNGDGEYIIELSTLPAAIRASYIGYNSQEVAVTVQTPDRLDIRLVPSPVELEAVEVSSMDPAVRIMREVIRRKQLWRARLDSYKANAYTRFTMENDTTVVAVSECISDLLWDREKGLHETVISQRNTNNVTPETFFAASERIPNLYDDYITYRSFARFRNGEKVLIFPV